MNFIDSGYLKLLVRNEGKIKSYDSCFDLRAWSHDLGMRDRYLREWMKCDMPVYVLPLCSLLKSARTMTYKSARKVFPRCNPNCKSKVLLESICSSCAAMTECLKEDVQYEKYFEEEEFEASHWPCETCIETLKNIKMLWKIIVDKLFCIKIPVKLFKKYQSSHTDSIQTLAKNWEKEIVHQTVYVKNITVCSSKTTDTISKSTKDVFKYNNDNFTKTPEISSINYDKKSKHSLPNNVIKSQTTTAGKDFDSTITKEIKEKKPRRRSKRVEVKAKTLDKGCSSCNLNMDSTECEIYKKNYNYLQKRFSKQRNDMQSLKRENVSLKAKLENAYNKNNRWHVTCKYGLDDDLLETNMDSVIPTPYEHTVESQTVGKIDSEMIITLKNCSNKSFKHISFLQVLHKTNETSVDEHSCGLKCVQKNEDPIHILTKVQNAVGHMVNREMVMVNSDEDENGKLSKINATYQRLDGSNFIIH